MLRMDKPKTLLFLPVHLCEKHKRSIKLMQPIYFETKTHPFNNSQSSLDFFSCAVWKKIRKKKKHPSLDENDAQLRMGERKTVLCWKSKEIYGNITWDRYFSHFMQPTSVNANKNWAKKLNCLKKISICPINQR